MSLPRLNVLRQITLPEGANHEQAKEFRDGVLYMTLPVPEQKSDRRSIPIESGSASEQKK